MTLSRRRGFMTQKELIPSEYKQVEWLYNNGNAYIDSGIECTSDLAVRFKFVASDSLNRALCGGIDLSTSPIYFRHHCSPYGGRLAYWIQHDSSGTAQFNPLHTVGDVAEVFIDPKNGIGEMNGISGTFNPMTTLRTTGKNYGIFARIASDGTLQTRNASFYYFKFYRNDQLIGDFVPCVRKSDNKPGMYDTVTRTFFTNAGAGEFIIPQ